MTDLHTRIHQLERDLHELKMDAVDVLPRLEEEAKERSMANLKYSGQSMSSNDHTDNDPPIAAQKGRSVDMLEAEARERMAEAGRSAAPGRPAKVVSNDAPFLDDADGVAILRTKPGNNCSSRAAADLLGVGSATIARTAEKIEHSREILQSKGIQPEQPQPTETEPMEYKQAVRELIQAYDAFHEANERVRAMEKGEGVAWPQPTIQPGGADAKEWRRRMARFENQD